MALECANFDIEKARIFLNAMTPQDSEKYMPKVAGSKDYELVTLPCKGIQTGAFVEIMPGTPMNLRRHKADKM